MSTLEDMMKCAYQVTVKKLENKIVHYKEIVQYQHLIFWPVRQGRFHCNTAKLEPNQRNSIGFPLRRSTGSEFCLFTYKNPLNFAMRWLRQLVANLSLWRSRFTLQSVHVGFVMDNAEMEQVFLRLLWTSPTVSFHCGSPHSYRICGSFNETTGK
jgi:hypothetical protein